MKRFIIGVIMAVMIFGISCGQKAEEKSAFDSDNPVTINLWHYYLGDNQLQIEKMADEFNNTVGAEKGITVNPIAKGTVKELEEAVEAAALGLIDSEEIPDIFSAYPDKAYQLSEKGILCDLNKYFSTEELSEYVPGFLQDGYLKDEHLYLIPIAKSTELLYVNETDFDAFAKDNSIKIDDLKTWEGILDASRKYYEYTDSLTPAVNGDGKSLMGFDSVLNYFVVACKQLGVDVIDGDRKCAYLKTDALKKVFDNFYEGFVMGYYGEHSKYRADDVKAGIVLMYVGSSSSTAYFPAWTEDAGKSRDIKCKVMPYPYFRDSQPYAIRQGAGMCVSASNPVKEEAACTFLKWFTETEQNLDFIGKTGYLPVMLDAYDNPKLVYDHIDKVSENEVVKENTIAAYELSKDNILSEYSFAAFPYEKSYDIRNALGPSMKEMALVDKEDVIKMRQEGMNDADIISQIDIDAQFDLWLEQVCKHLYKEKIKYIKE